MSGEVAKASIDESPEPPTRWHALASGPPAFVDLGGGMVTSCTIGKLAAALARAQGKFGPLSAAKTARVTGKSKDGRPVSYTYQYADLSGALDAALPALSSEGLSVIQGPGVTPLPGPRGDQIAEVTVTTLLAHESGEWIRSTVTLVAGSLKPQDVGSAITYARRYALLAIVGLAPDDDDGASAQRSHRPPQSAPRDVRPPPQPAVAAADDGTVAELRAALDSATTREHVQQVATRITALPESAAKATLLTDSREKYRDLGEKGAAA